MLREFDKHWLVKYCNQVREQLTAQGKALPTPNRMMKAMFRTSFNPLPHWSPEEAKIAREFGDSLVANHDEAMRIIAGCFGLM